MDLLKLAICVPHMGTVKALFAQSLAELIAHSLSVDLHINDKPVKLRIETLFSGEGTLDLKRNRLALASRQRGSDLTLWLDSDHTFPPQAFITLLSRDRPLIGCNYPTRDAPGKARPTAMMLDREPVETTQGKAEGRLIEEVVTIGFGLVLMQTAILDRIPQPWFSTRVAPDGDLECGEDVHFCNQARAAGIPVFVDHALSWEVGHLTELPLRFRDLTDGR